jgi:hypothetical protein
MVNALCAFVEDARPNTVPQPDVEPPTQLTMELN